MSTPREIAEAFSGHRFADAYPALAPDVRWVSVGAGELAGRQAVVDACEATLAALSGGTTESLRFLVIAAGDAVASSGTSTHRRRRSGRKTGVQRSGWARRVSRAAGTPAARLSR